MNLPRRDAANVGRRHGPEIEPADLARGIFVAVSPKMLLLQQQIGRLSHIDSSVLITGVLAIRSLMPSVNNAAATSDETVETERFLRDFRGSRTLMAAALGISRTTLWRRQRRIEATTR